MSQHSTSLTATQDPEPDNQLFARGLSLADDLALLVAALDSTRKGFMIIDMLQPKRPIIFVNRTLVQRSGYTHAELVGRPSAMLTPRDDNTERNSNIRDAMIAGDEISTRVRSMRKDGSRYWSAVSLTPIRDANQRVTHYVSFSADLTIRLEAERKQQELTEKLEAAIRERDRVELDLRLAQKLEAVGRLAAGIAHEINTPIQYVGDSAQFLGTAYDDYRRALQAYRDGIDALANGDSIADVRERLAAAEQASDIEFLDAEVPKAISRTAEGVERVAKIVRAMKEFSHPDSSAHGPADINHAIESTLTVAKNEYKYVADVETDLGSLPLVTCNIDQLNQVFLNLIVNAAHAIEARHQQSGGGRITIATRQVGDQVELVFGDNGCGIPQQHLDKIYDPFFTTKEVGKGTGQGLAITRSIVVDRHKGTLQVQSTVGQGSQFLLRLPINREQSQEDEA